MFSTSRNLRQVIGRRLAHSAPSSSSSAKSTFNNKFKFDINPPQIHHFWNYKNGSVLLLFVPVYVGIAYLAQNAGSNLSGYEGLSSFAEGPKSPMKEIAFGEPQSKTN